MTMRPDPRIHELASCCVDALLHARNRPVVPSVRAALVDRLAGALQQAFEQEIEDIERDLTCPRASADQEIEPA